MARYRPPRAPKRLDSVADRKVNRARSIKSRPDTLSAAGRRRPAPILVKTAPRRGENCASMADRVSPGARPDDTLGSALHARCRELVKLSCYLLC